jgi:four helix bundle suffix protein
MQNIPEGYKQQGISGYIKLAGVSRGSLEELLRDYHAYARQHGIVIYPKDRAIREIEEIGEIWRIIRGNPYLPDHPDFPDLPSDPEHAVNMMITIINQANYLIDKLIDSLKERHTKEGGLTEELYRKRKEFRDKK